jgi:hypothetical protein
VTTRYLEPFRSFASRFILFNNGEHSWVRYFGWCSLFLFKLALRMSAIFPVLSRAKQRPKRLGAKPVLSRLRASRPTPARRAIHHLHPDRQTTQGVTRTNG